MIRNQRTIGMAQIILPAMLVAALAAAPLHLAAEEAAPTNQGTAASDQPSGAEAAPGVPATVQAPEPPADQNAPATEQTPAEAPSPEQTAPAPASGTGEARNETASGKTAAGGENIQAGETLTLSRCIDIALRKNPGVVAAENTVEVNRNRLGEARSYYYPQVSATASYTRSRTIPTVSGIPLSTYPPAFDTTSGSVMLNQNIYDFGRTSSSVNVSKYNFESSRSDLDFSRDSIILGVKQAYYGVLQAQRSRDVAADVIKQFQLHLDQAKGFYEVGTKARIDVIKAEVDLSNAKLSLINAENALKIALVTLNNAMGVPDSPEYTIEDNLSFQQYPITLEEATAKAFENRPDLKSIVALRHGAEANISLQRSDYYPSLSGIAEYIKSESDIPTNANTTTKSWDIGVALTWPLFNGFLTRHRVAEARSSFYAQRAKEEGLRQQVLLDVRQAYLNLQAAEASIATAELAAKQAQENLDLANGRYAAGVGSPIEVSDAFATYVTAKASYTNALYNYRIAQANIEKAMGAR